MSLSRRSVLMNSAAFMLHALPMTVSVAAAPAASTLIPELIAAARKEGQIAWYTSVDLPIAEKVARKFEANYSGIAVRVERSGSERLFQRLAQEFASRIHVADVVNTSDGAHFLGWKRGGLLEPYVPAEAAQQLPNDRLDADGSYMTWRASLSVIAYNTSMVKADEAPKSFADLLDPKWTGKIVKGHPGYSGTIMTATSQLVDNLGWQYFEKLARQRVMQVQSSTDPPKKLALGERVIMADGNEYNVFRMKEAGVPIEPVYPTEGAPLVTGPSAIFRTAPHPNAARLFQHYLFASETQQMICDVGGLRSFHRDVIEKAGRKPLREIKLMREDYAEVESHGEEIKSRYEQLFGL